MLTVTFITVDRVLPIWNWALYYSTYNRLLITSPMTTHRNCSIIILHFSGQWHDTGMLPGSLISVGGCFQNGPCHESPSFKGPLQAQGNLGGKSIQWDFRHCTSSLASSMHQRTLAYPQRGYQWPGRGLNISFCPHGDIQTWSILHRVESESYLGRYGMLLNLWLLGTRLWFIWSSAEEVIWIVYWAGILDPGAADDRLGQAPSAGAAGNA